MALFSIDLLGPARIDLAGRSLSVRVRKELALLAYLAVEQAHRHSRDSLLGLLWPDDPEQVTRNNLRGVLSGLRRRLGPHSDAFVRADRQQLQFVADSDHTLDVITFRRLLAAVRVHPHSNTERCEACVARLAEAVELYQ